MQLLIIIALFVFLFGTTSTSAQDILLSLLSDITPIGGRSSYVVLRIELGLIACKAMTYLSNPNIDNNIISMKFD